jgi:hypothetical protein
LCGSQPCWRGGSTKVEYRDRNQVRTSTSRIKAKPGGDGKASISFTSAGPSLGPPMLPFGGPITAQLVNLATGTCWTATYSDALKNDVGIYKGRSD